MVIAGDMTARAAPLMLRLRRDVFYPGDGTRIFTFHFGPAKPSHSDYLRLVRELTETAPYSLRATPRLYQDSDGWHIRAVALYETPTAIDPADVVPAWMEVFATPGYAIKDAARWFEEKTVLWKLVAVAVIGAAGAYIVYKFGR